MFENRNDVYYVVENANWAVLEVGKDIIHNLKKVRGKIVTKTRFITRDAYIHYGSLNVFLNDKKVKKRKGNKVIVTCFHIVDSDPRKMMIPQLDEYVKCWHTSCEITKRKLIHLGIAEKKICVIPIGVDTKNYFIIDEKDKKEKRDNLNIPRNATVIGYFQKDGNGWGDGDTPKLIKGPDVFCDVVEKIAKKQNIFILLSGPARGYVKKRLEAAGIPFFHFLFDEAKEVAKLYQLIDIYMVTSREEGGPRAILESMASGVPIISTRVGEAPDIIENGKNGILVDVENRMGLEEAFERVMSDIKLRERLIVNGLQTAQQYDVVKLAQQYEEMLYQ